MKNTVINRNATVKIAKALGNLNQKVVFVGGAMVSLYIDDEAAEDIRPTKDIDLTFQVSTVLELEKLREKLNKKGFNESNDENVICRFRYDDLLVDVMSTQEVGWAPSNRWFEKGFKKAVEVLLDDTVIRILPLPYFLASKMDAFWDRGLKDLYGSPDFEDIVYIFNYSSYLVEEILKADKAVSRYIKNSVQKILEDESIMSALPGHLYFDGLDERMEIITDKMKKISSEL